MIQFNGITENRNEKENEMKKKKTKEKKKIEFNIADYDYMDDMPLIGWVWEFMRRSDEYIKFWEIGPRSDGYKVFWGDEAGNPDIFIVGDKRWMGKNPNEKWTSEYLEWLDPGLHEVVSKSKPVDVTNMMFSAMKDQYENDMSFKVTSVGKRNKILGLSESLPSEGTISASQFMELLSQGAIAPAVFKTSDRLRLIKHCSIEESSDIDSEGITRQLKYCIMHDDKSNPLEKLMNVNGKHNVVMALIDISAPENIDKILATVKKEILFWRKRLKLQKPRCAKVSKKNKNELIKNAKIWKSYLMVYDLLNNGITPSEATKILSKYDDHYSEMNTVIRHSIRANALINGGYKEYL